MKVGLLSVVARLRDDREAGFTLVETLVAMVLATAMFTSLAYAATAAVQASQVARQNQQAADLANAQIEDFRQRPWGSLGHGSVQCPDTNLTSCGSNANYNGEPLVSIAGGISPQITQTTTNGVTYTVNSYVTRPADTTGNYRRVTAVVTWNDYGRPRTKVASTIVSESTRGLPIPDFTLTPVGTLNAQVNPGAEAYWGFELTNQGAPDQWNITTSGDFQPTLYRDNGDSIFSPSTDIVQLTDSNSDGDVDTARLDPQQSLKFWAVYSVPSGASNGQLNASVTARSASQPDASTATKSLAITLTVASGVITATPTPTPTVTPTSTPSATPTPSPTGSASNATCADPTPAPTPAASSGYTRKEYTLNNSGNTAWPTLPLPTSGTIPGSAALSPMVMNLDTNAIPTGRTLPVLSTDLAPPDTPGRILYNGGTFTGGITRVADWLNSLPSATYTGSVVLRTYVDRLPGGTGDVALRARLYEYRSSGNKTNTLLSEQSVNLAPYSCNGFQKVSFNFPISTPMALSKNYVLGVRIWNTGSASVRLAYDHADYPSTLTVVEK